MEILSGMILLVQVVILIQIMLVEKQVLQRIGALEAKINDSEEGTIAGDALKLSDVEMESMAQEQPENSREKEEQEALLNEVLSEVFS